jgi:glycosyl transferase, family 25
VKFFQSFEKKYKKVRNKYRRKIQDKALQARWEQKSSRPSVGLKDNLTGFDRCDVHFINLKFRKDRKAEILQEFKRVGLSNFSRFDAVSDENGALGCAKSHVKLLEAARVNQHQLLMICEDDCQFVIDRSKLDGIVEEFFCNPYLEVLCLGNNAKNGFQISPALMITSDTQTTSCYLVKSQAISLVLESARKSVQKLSCGEPSGEFAIDIVWKELQKKVFFALPKDLCVKQRASFSNIQNSYNDYGT